MTTALQVFSERDGVVVARVAGGEEQRHGFFRLLAVEQLHGFALMP